MALSYLKLLVTNNSSNPLVDQQVRVLQPLIDNLDIAVYTDVERTTLFNWWVQEAGDFWLKLNLPVGATQVLHVYWGDEESNASRGDGNNVFDFFDDFAGSTLDSNKWSNTGGDFNISDSRLRVNTGSVYSTNTVASQPHSRLEAKVRWHEVNGNYSGLVMADAQGLQDSNAGSNSLVLYIKRTGNTPWVAGWAGSGNTTGYDLLNAANFFTLTPEQEYEMVIRIDDSRIRWITDGHQFREINGSWSAPYYIILGYWTGSNAGVTDGADISYDWVRVRKCPTFSVVTTQDWSWGTYPGEIGGSGAPLTGFATHSATIFDGEASDLGRTDAKLIPQPKVIKWGGAFPLVGRHGH